MSGHRQVVDLKKRHEDLRRAREGVVHRYIRRYKGGSESTETADTVKNDLKSAYSSLSGALDTVASVDKYAPVAATLAQKYAPTAVANVVTKVASQVPGVLGRVMPFVAPAAKVLGAVALPVQAFSELYNYGSDQAKQNSEEQARIDAFQNDRTQNLSADFATPEDKFQKWAYQYRMLTGPGSGVGGPGSREKMSPQLQERIRAEMVRRGMDTTPFDTSKRSPSWDMDMAKAMFTGDYSDIRRQEFNYDDAPALYKAMYVYHTIKPRDLRRAAREDRKNKEKAALASLKFENSGGIRNHDVARQPIEMLH